MVLHIVYSDLHRGWNLADMRGAVCHYPGSAILLHVLGLRTTVCRHGGWSTGVAKSIALSNVRNFLSIVIKSHFPFFRKTCCFQTLMNMQNMYCTPLTCGLRVTHMLHNSFELQSANFHHDFVYRSIPPGKVKILANTLNYARVCETKKLRTIGMSFFVRRHDIHSDGPKGYKVSRTQL